MHVIRLAELARRSNVNGLTLRRSLAKVRDRDIKARGSAPWWIQPTPLSPIAINESLFYRWHPEFRAHSLAAKEDVERMMSEVVDIRSRLSAHGAAIRELRTARAM
jgi:hypothetical protein